MAVPVIEALFGLISASFKQKQFAKTFYTSIIRNLSAMTVSISIGYALNLALIQYTDNVSNAQLQTLMQHEGKFEARSVNIPWPARIMPE